MSVIIGAHLGRYVMLASDTRSVRYDEAFTKIVKVRDGYPKMKASGNLLMAGSGVCGLLDGVMARLPQATTVGAMLDIIGDEQRTYWADPVRAKHQDAEHTQTGFMVSYDSGTELRLAYYHPSMGHAFTLAEPGAGASFVPSYPTEHHLREDLQEELNAALQAGVRLCGPDESIAESASYHMTLMRSVLALAARRIPTSISRDTCIGLHMEAGEILCQVYPPLATTRTLAFPQVASTGAAAAA